MVSLTQFEEKHQLAALLGLTLLCLRKEYYQLAALLGLTLLCLRKEHDHFPAH